MLRILQSLFAEAERRGYEIGPVRSEHSRHRNENGVAIAVREHDYLVEIVVREVGEDATVLPAEI